MTNDKALQILYSWHGEDEESDEVVSIAVKAIEKQVPEKPKMDKNFKVMFCECGARILPGQRYCSYCGQKMDWSEWSD